MRTDWYVLDSEHNAIPVKDSEVYMQSIQDRRVDRDELGDVEVSTVFLGLDHGVYDGPPLLFETMVFGGEYDGEQWRCTTWDEAVEQHAMVVNKVFTPRQRIMLEQKRKCEASRNGKK